MLIIFVPLGEPGSLAVTYGRVSSRQSTTCLDNNLLAGTPHLAYFSGFKSVQVKKTCGHPFYWMYSENCPCWPCSEAEGLGWFLQTSPLNTWHRRTLLLIPSPQAWTHRFCLAKMFQNWRCFKSSGSAHCDVSCLVGGPCQSCQEPCGRALGVWSCRCTPCTAPSLEAQNFAQWSWWSLITAIHLSLVRACQFQQSTCFYCKHIIDVFDSSLHHHYLLFV